MTQVYHYQVFVCDAKGERQVAQYSSYNISLARDEVAHQLKRLLEDQMAGRSIGEGWVRLACIEDDTKSVMVGLL
jgi:hypothetical protein